MHCSLGVRTLKWGPQTEDGVLIQQWNRNGVLEASVYKADNLKAARKTFHSAGRN